MSVSTMTSADVFATRFLFVSVTRNAGNVLAKSAVLKNTTAFGNAESRSDVTLFEARSSPSGQPQYACLPWIYRQCLCAKKPYLSPPIKSPTGYARLVAGYLRLRLRNRVDQMEEESWASSCIWPLVPT